MGQVKNYYILIEAASDLSEGARWYKRCAESPESAVAQLVSDLGSDGKNIAEALVVEAEGMVAVTQTMRWEARS